MQRGKTGSLARTPSLCEDDAVNPTLSCRDGFCRLAGLEEPATFGGARSCTLSDKSRPSFSTRRDSVGHTADLFTPPILRGGSDLFSGSGRHVPGSRETPDLTETSCLLLERLSRSKQVWVMAAALDRSRTSHHRRILFAVRESGCFTLCPPVSSALSSQSSSITPSVSSVL